VWRETYVNEPDKFSEEESCRALVGAIEVSNHILQKNPPRRSGAARALPGSMLLDIAEAAADLRCAPRTVRALIAAGRIPVVSIPGEPQQRTFIRRSDLRRYIESLGTTAAPSTSVERLPDARTAEDVIATGAYALARNAGHDERNDIQRAADWLLERTIALREGADHA